MSSTNFQELNLSNGFLFPAALEDPITCRLVLECMLEEPIGQLSVKVEYTKLYNSEFKCIRLDVFSKDTVTNVSYNLEMQNKNEYDLPFRSRYYQAEIDVANLKPGDDYTDLKPLYVIFICNFDPFGQDLYRYSFSMQCEERSFPLNDGAKRIFFNTRGKNADEVSPVLLNFLGYLNDSTDNYIEYNPDDKVKEIHNRIKILKKNRYVEARYMHYLYVDEVIAKLDKALEDKNKELESASKELESANKELESANKELETKDTLMHEMIFETIGELGKVSDVVRERIRSEKNSNILKSIHTIAVKTASVEQFEREILNL